jgi:hypothetical protein
VVKSGAESDSYGRRRLDCAEIRRFLPPLRVQHLASYFRDILRAKQQRRVDPSQSIACIPGHADPRPRRFESWRRFRNFSQFGRRSAYRRHVIPRLGAIAVVAFLVLSQAAQAHRGDGVFTLGAGAWLPWFGADVAMLTDGSVLTSDGWRLAPDGTRAQIEGLSGSGVAATADGGAVVLGGHRVAHWTAATGVSVVAGTGMPGFAGDGGPATAALVNLEPRAEIDPSGIVARSDGGFVFTDTGNRRIRAVDGADAIRTIAGGPGVLRDPTGLAATPNGGLIVTEAHGGRVLDVAPDGTVKVVARSTYANDVVVTPDGTTIINDPYSGELWRLDVATGRLQPYLRPKSPTDTFDFAARSVFGQAISIDAHGGLVTMGPPGSQEEAFPPVVRYVAAGPTPWVMAALRKTVTSRTGLTAIIETTQPGVATLKLLRRGRRVARVTQEVPAGHTTLRAVGPIEDRWYDVQLRLDGAGGTRAQDAVPVHGARALTVPLARRLLGRSQGSTEFGTLKLGSKCRRFGRLRVDCIVRTADSPSSCVGIASVRLAASGVVLRRNYECGRRRFKARPRFIASHGVQRLSRGDGGSWFDY